MPASALPFPLATVGVVVPRTSPALAALRSRVRSMQDQGEIAAECLRFEDLGEDGYLDALAPRRWSDDSDRHRKSYSAS